jgi:hypothetical protein
MHVFEYREESVNIGTAILLALFVGVSIVFSPKLGVILAILPALVYFMLADKENALLLLLAFIPFHTAPILDQNLLGIPGAKPFSLFAVLTLFVFFYHRGQLLYSQDKQRRMVVIYLGIYLIIFSVVIFRSLYYFPLLHLVDAAKFPSTRAYLLSYYIKPTLYLVSFVYILGHVTTERDIERIIYFLCLVSGALSIVVIFIVLFHGDILTGSRAASVKYWSRYLGQHYNDIGTLYIILGPLVCLPALQKRMWGMINWSLVFVAVILLQSRTTLLVFLLGCLLMLYFLERKKELIFLSSLAFLFSLYFLPGFLMNTLQTGFASGDLNKISTGRVYSIWMPLLTEWFHDAKLFLIGNGRFALMSSHVYQRGMMELVGHPHNAYVEFFLDNGIILFGGFMFALMAFLKSAFKYVRKVNTDIGWALFVSMICYLIGCFSGRSFYPTEENPFIFVIVALTVNYALLHTTTTMNHSRVVAGQI